jgi:hypothetical protein
MELPDPPPNSVASLGPLRNTFADALRFWEPRRAIYNVILAAVTGTWLAATWPHFRPAFTLQSLMQLSGLALLANLCYTSAYLLDLPLQRSPFSAFWKRCRWLLFVTGTLFAVILTNYWIADEIYPFVQ